MRLTDLGELVEAEGRRLLERYDHLKREVGAHLRLESGTVRIGGGATAVSFLLPPLIRDFRLDHSDVVFHVKEAGSREIAADVAGERLELGIVTLPAESAELEVILLQSEPGIQFEFAISAGVRYGDGERKQVLEELMVKTAAPMQAVFAEYDVPLLEMSLDTNAVQASDDD